MKYRLLRFLLFASAFAWGVSAVGVVLSWPAALIALQGLGVGEIPYDPMLDYWLRMAAGAFTGVGIFFFIVGLWPSKFSNVIGILAVLMFLEGIVILVHGFRLGLSPFPFYSDAGFCLLVGAGIWILKDEAKKASKDPFAPWRDTPARRYARLRSFFRRIQMKYQDEIITEVWQNRDAYAARHHHNLREIVADLQKRQQRPFTLLVDRRHRTTASNVQK